MASAPMASAMTMTRPTLSWSQVMNVERFMRTSARVARCVGGSEPAQEVPDVGIVAGGHVLGGPEEADLPVGQQGDLGRHEERRPDVVRHDDAGDLQLALELPDEPRDRAGR